MQADLVTAPHSGNHTIFCSGPPGAGKTTLAVRRLQHLLEAGIPAEQILILVPQRTLAGPYFDFVRGSGAPPGGVVDVATIGGLARRTLELFWPLVAGPAGFRPDLPPHFLTLETAQYYMDRLAEPFLADGAFEGISISRPRLVSQIIDNLNKAAAVGFGVDEIAARLQGAWSGESARLRIYDQVQALALAFRRACLAGNLLDWSLQIEVFWRHLLPLPQLRRYLLGGYRHLIVDNTEEDIPACHDLLRIWLPLCESALVIHDTGGGYRLFLGADPEGGLALADLCRERLLLSGSHVSTPAVESLARQLAAPFAKDDAASAAATEPTPRPDTRPDTRPDPTPALEFEVRHFHPQMVDWVAAEIGRLVLDEGLPPGEIAILAPFLSDALRFSLEEKLGRYNIQVRSHRPSRELREEPATRCLLTLARLAHPAWHRPPPAADVAHALLQSIADMDPVRARLLTDIVYRVRDGQPSLTPFHQIVPSTQERISYLLGTRYDELRGWIEDYAGRSRGAAGAGRTREMAGREAADTEPPGDGQAGDGEGLDHFLSRLFGEILSQPGFGFHRDFDAGAAAANLIESIQKFRQAMPAALPAALPAEQALGDPNAAPGGAERLPGPSPSDLNLEYLDMVERGVVAAQYIASWQIHPGDAVLAVPAYTFLMRNQPVSVQFWLDAGSRAWAERIYQPLTHPYVLRRDWQVDQAWSDEDEVRTRDEALARLIVGLARRCRSKIYLALSELDERGFEQQGPLRQALQGILRRAARQEPAPGSHAP